MYSHLFILGRVALAPPPPRKFKSKKNIWYEIEDEEIHVD